MTRTSGQGTLAEASIWTLDERDTTDLSGAGLLLVEVKNVYAYPMSVHVNAHGEKVRWETQPDTNTHLDVLIDSGESMSISRIFEVENTQPEHPNELNVSVEINRLHISDVRAHEMKLVFFNSATSKLLYRKESFELLCAIVLPDYEVVDRELIEYLATHPDDLYSLKPRKFEELLDSIFRNLGYRTELGPGWNDEGVDLRLYTRDDVGEILTLVQAKKYHPKRPIDLQPVAALSAIVDQQKAQRGLFVTTSRFLPVAKRFAEKEARRIVLADSNDVSQWCARVIRRFQ